METGPWSKVAAGRGKKGTPPAEPAVQQATGRFKVTDACRALCGTQVPQAILAVPVEARGRVIGSKGQGLKALRDMDGVQEVTLSPGGQLTIVAADQASLDAAKASVSTRINKSVQVS